MLSWKLERDGWVSNGYRIELAEPFRWVLLRNEPWAAQVVQTESVPLAETRTLALCKREAELLDKARRLAVIRRRMWGRLIVALTAFVFVPSLPSPWELVSFLIILVAAAGAGGLLAGTYMASSHAAVRDLTGPGEPAGDDRFSLWVTRFGMRSRVGM